MPGTCDKCLCVLLLLILSRGLWSQYYLVHVTYVGSEAFQLFLALEGWEPVFPLRSPMLEGRLAASLLQNFLGKWWEALQDPGGTSGPHPHPTSRKLNVHTSLGNCFFCLLSPLPLVSQKRAQRLLELGHIRVYFAIALWGIMGCLRLCLGIDLQLHSCVIAWMYGEDFVIAVGCPGSLEMKGHPYELWAHLGSRGHQDHSNLTIAMGQGGQSTMSPRPWFSLGVVTSPKDTVRLRF